MTEAEWNCCEDPQAMLEFLRTTGKASDRKLRLFAVACVRRVWPRLTEEQNRRAVDVVEQFIEGRASADQLHAVTSLAWGTLGWDEPASTAAFVAATGGLIVPALAAWGASTAAAGSVATSSLVRLHAWHGGYVARDIGSAWAAGDADQEQNWLRFVAACPKDTDAAHDQERAAQAALLHCIVGSLPFISVSVNPTWSVRRLAEVIYEDRHLPGGTLDNGHLAILGDALEEAGCDNEDILRHCREQGRVHVRGCWVVDLLLGKG